MVNPIAGMGGRVGLKGTDGVSEEALAMGAEPVAPGRALETLRAFATWDISREVHWLTCTHPMGAEELRVVGFMGTRVQIVHEAGRRTSAADTKTASRSMADSGAEVILFCGGDGTSRDILDSVDGRIPILGIPAGVKMHSAVFGHTPEAAGITLARFLMGELAMGETEIIDLDEDRYRAGEWNLRLYGLAQSPQEPNLVQSGKLMVQELGDEEIWEEMADYLRELMEEEPQTLFIFGPGGTTHGICEKLGVGTTLLGVDALVAGQLVGRDLNEDGLLRLLKQHPKARLVLSPIGAQGFILGRGNLQLSPQVLLGIGAVNLIVVSTPAKLRRTPFLRFDSGDRQLDNYFKTRGHMMVVTGYRTMKLHPVQ